MGHSVDLLNTAGQCTHNYRIIDLLLLACQLCVMRSQGCIIIATTAAGTRRCVC